MIVLNYLALHGRESEHAMAMANQPRLSGNLDPLMAEILPQLPPGARIVAHEHTPYRGQYPPDEKRLLVGTRGFTVGYLWRVAN